MVRSFIIGSGLTELFKYQTPSPRYPWFHGCDQKPSCRIMSLVTQMTAKIISIETKRCCDCGKTIPKKSEQFMVNDKQVACSDCWTIRAHELVQHLQISN